MNNQDKEKVKFKGTIIKNRFNSEDFKIYIAEVDSNKYNVKLNKEGKVTVIGNLSNLIPNLEYEFIGIKEYNTNFGFQYNITSVRRDKPTDYNNSFIFLKELISEQKARILLAEYPNIIDKIIKNDLDDIDLNKTKGIKEKTFNDIKDKVISNFCLIDIVDIFSGLISLNTIKKLYDKYHNADIVKNKLINNPYKCLCDLSRVGFKTADSILLTLQKQSEENPNSKFHFKYDLKHSKERMKACILYMLDENEGEGNTCMDLIKCREACGKLVPECINHFVNIIKENDKYIHVDLKSKTISKTSTYLTEVYISLSIKTMINKENIVKWNIDTSKYKSCDGYELTDEQLKTLDMICDNNIGILTSPAGAGKSSSVLSLINMLDDNNKTYTLMTPTGASSKVLADYTHKDCGTIHRKLGYIGGEWSFNKNHKLDTDIVIIDEFSMVGTDLFYRVLDAIDIKNTKILLVFDSYQLPSVSCGNLAQDLLSSNVIPTTRLTKIFRYAEGGLMKIATDIRNSIPFIDNSFKKGVKIFGKNKDFVYIETNPFSTKDLYEKLLTIYKNLIDSNNTIDDIMILSPQNKGDYGTENINKLIQNKIFGNHKDKHFIKVGKDNYFWEGDKVIQITNNYNAETEEGGITQIFNGNTGVITKIYFDKIYVSFDNVVIVYEKETLLNNLKLGYCITNHKSQGSNSKNVIMLGVKQHTFMLDSNLLYVGVTRTKLRCYMLGNIHTVNSSIKKKQNLSRNTYLPKLLK